MLFELCHIVSVEKPEAGGKVRIKGGGNGYVTM